MKHWDSGLVYGHLYNKTTISEIAKTLGIQKSTCLVSWDVIYVRGHFDHSDGHVHGACCPPIPYQQFLQTPNNTTMEPRKKIVFLDSKTVFAQRLKALNILSSDLKLGTIYETILKKKISNQHTATADEIMQKVFDSEKSYSEHWKTCLRDKTDLKSFLLVFKSKKLLPDCDLSSDSRYLLN